MMNFKLIPRVMTALTVVVCLASCVKKEYEISEENLDLEVTLFQEGLTVPIGSTDTIRFEQVLSMFSDTIPDFFKHDGGFYSIYLSDSFNFSGSLSQIDDLDVIEIDAIGFSADMAMASDIGGYAPDPGQLSADFLDVKCEGKFLPIPAGVNIPSAIVNDTPVSLSGLSDLLKVDLNCAETFEVAGAPMTMEVNVEVPKGVKKISDIVINENASVTISVELKNSIFTAGSIKPAIDLDVHDLLCLSDQENSKHPEKKDHIVKTFDLNAANGFSDSQTYDIKALAFDEDDWANEDGQLVLDKLVTIAAAGSFSFDGLMTTTRKLSETKGDVTVSVTVKFNDFEIENLVMDVEPVEFSYGMNLNLDLFSDEDAPEILTGVGPVNLNDVYLSFALDFSTIKEVTDADIALDLGLSLPGFIVIEDPRMQDGKVRLAGSLDENGIYADKIKIASLDMSGLDFKAEDGVDLSCGIEGSVTMSDVSFDFDALADCDELGIGLQVSICNPETNMIEVRSLSAKLDYQIDPIKEKIDLTSIAEDMGSENLKVKFDVDKFSLMLQVKTNLGVPIGADIIINPVYDGVVDEEKSIRLVDIDLKAAADASEVAVTSLYISNNDKGCPAGYEYRRADILALLSDIPDYLEISVEAGTDPDTYFVFEPGAEYTFSADYAIDIPLAFGENTVIEFNSVIPDLPDFVSTILSAGGLGLVGNFTNSYPLELELNLNLLDSKGNVVNLSEDSGILHIQPCDLDGKPVTSQLNFLFQKKDGVSVDDIDALELVFKATSKKAAGVPLTKDSFIKAEIQAVIPEGLTFDLKDLTVNDGGNK